MRTELGSLYTEKGLTSGLLSPWEDRGERVKGDEGKREMEHTFCAYQSLERR